MVLVWAVRRDLLFLKKKRHKSASKRPHGAHTSKSPVQFMNKHEQTWRTISFIKIIKVRPKVEKLLLNNWLWGIFLNGQFLYTPPMPFFPSLFAFLPFLHAFLKYYFRPFFCIYILRICLFAFFCILVFFFA